MTTCYQPTQFALPESQCIGDEFANARIPKRTRASATIEVVFDSCHTVFFNQDPLGRQ
jgi:hypothetical protein